MDEGDGETMYSYYCLHRFHWPPSRFLGLDIREKAAVIAMIDERIKNEKKQAGRRAGRRR